MAASVWAFYYIQGEDGEDRAHPNAFKVPLAGGGAAAADVTLADVQRHFPLAGAARDFHFRFRLNAKAGDGSSTFFWLDVAAPAQKVPLVNGRVICKLLRLARPERKGLVFRRKPVLQWAGGDKADAASSVQPLGRQPHHKHKTPQPGSEPLPFHRSASEPGFDQGRPTKYSDEQKQKQQQAAQPRAHSGSSSGGEAPGSGRKSGGSGPPSRTGSGSSKAEQTAPPESFEDFLSGGQSSAPPSQQATRPKSDVNLMSASAWSDDPPPATPKKSANSFLDAMDPLAQTNNAPSASNSSNSSRAAPPTEQPKFEDDNGQTVGPVTMAEMKEFSKSTSDGSNVYNPNLVDKSTKSEHVRRAMEERERQVRADVEKAREELRQRDEAARAMTAMKESANAVLGPQLKAWAEDNGRVKNIRTLLSTMHQVMWDGSKWSEVNMGKLIQPNDVKKHYRKAMIVVHPDKSGGRNAEQLLIAERVFSALNTAWEEFVKANPC